MKCLNFEICILEVQEMYLITHDHQFGLKKNIRQTCVYLR